MLSVYPNPGNGKIKVVSDYDWNEVIASDITGRIIYKKKIDGHFHDLDLTFLGRGLYVLNFSGRDHQSHLVKIIIN
jgi:hypothetical protein